MLGAPEGSSLEAATGVAFFGPEEGLSAVAATPIVGTAGGTGLGSRAGISESVNGQVPWVSRWRWERRFGGGPGGAWQAVGKC